MLAPLIVEAEWNAATTSVKQKLAAKNIEVVPWSLATVGALMGAYFESREAQIVRGSDELIAKTRTCVEQSFNKVFDYAQENEKSLDQGARQFAVERVAEYARMCGAESH